MAKGGGNKKIFQYCTDPSGQDILYLRALQGHSRRNPIDPTWINSERFLRVHLSRWMCNQFTLHHQFRIPGGQNLGKRQTVFFTSVDLMNKEHRDPDNIDLEAPCLHGTSRKTWKKHQNTVYWVDIRLAQKKGLKFYDRTQSSFTTHSQLIETRRLS